MVISLKHKFSVMLLAFVVALGLVPAMPACAFAAQTTTSPTTSLPSAGQWYYSSSNSWSFSSVNTGANPTTIVATVNNSSGILGTNHGSSFNVTATCMDYKGSYHYWIDGYEFSSSDWHVSQNYSPYRYLNYSKQYPTQNGASAYLAAGFDMYAQSVNTSTNTVTWLVTFYYSSPRTAYPIDNSSGSYVIQANYQRFQCQIDSTYSYCGNIKLVKTSSNTTITNNNSNYSLKGAKYGVYSNKACTTLVDTLSTNSSGQVTSNDLPAGTYYVKEITASTGYQLDTTAHKATVTSGNTTTLNVTETPKTAVLTINKVSSTPNITNNNPNYSLAGAVFGIYSNSACTTLVEQITTNANGVATSSNLPLNTYYVKEITASKGYKLKESSIPVNMTAGSNSTAISEDPINDPMYIWKTDKDNWDGVTTPTFGTNSAQGAATLQGSQFTVWYYTGLFGTTDGHLDANGNPTGYTRKWVFATDQNGWIKIDNEHFVSGDALYTDLSGNVTIPIGSVIVQETKAPEGYYLPGAEPNGTGINPYYVTKLVDYSNTFTVIVSADEVVKQNISVAKTDIDTGDPVGGAQFSLYRLDDDYVTVTNNTVSIDQAIDLSDDSFWTFVKAVVTDAITGIADFGKQVIGYFRVVETAAPSGYMTEAQTLAGGVAASPYYHYLATDVSTGESIIAVQDKAITIDVDIEETASTQTSATFDGTQFGLGNNVGAEELIYHINAANKSNTYVNSFVITTSLTTLTNKGIYLNKLWSGEATGDADGLVKLYYKTNLQSDNWLVWNDALSTSVSIELDVSTLGLAAGEYVTELKIDYGQVAQDFTVGNKYSGQDWILSYKATQPFTTNDSKLTHSVTATVGRNIDGSANALNPSDTFDLTASASDSVVTSLFDSFKCSFDPDEIVVYTNGSSILSDYNRNYKVTYIWGSVLPQMRDNSRESVITLVAMVALSLLVMVGCVVFRSERL